jgi:ketosteroid isomerase-like protein
LKRTTIVCALLLLAACGCVSERNTTVNPTAAHEVRRVLDKQVAEWNAGNLAGFMETYSRSDSTRFASGGDVILGWQTVFDRYRRKYGDKETMGTLRMSDVDVQMLAPDSALAFGHWHLTRHSGNLSGLYTLLLRKTPEGWRIVHDHTSSASSP